jgi:hypothetical protein
VSRRNPWAILYTSLIFGGIFVPYWYVGLLLCISLYLHVSLLDLGPAALVLLGASTVLVLGVFIVRTPVEQRLRERLGRLFAPLLALFLVLAAGELVLTTLANMNPLLMTPSGTWTHFMQIATISAVVAAVIVVVRPASRLERAITIRAAIRGIGRIVRLDMSRSRADFCSRVIGSISPTFMSVIAAVTSSSRIISTASFFTDPRRRRAAGRRASR